MCKFGILILGGSWKISFELGCPARVGSSCVSGSARRNLSPTWEYYLGMAVHAVHVKFGIHNVCHVNSMDI